MYSRKREEEQHTHGRDRILKLPPREQFAEGRLYDIINQDVINPQHISRYDGKVERSKNRMLKTAFEKRMHATGEAQLAQATELCLNRFAHQRHSDTYVHGYDPVTNQSFDGINSKPRIPTRTHDTLPVWQVLNDGVLSTNKVKATSSSISVKKGDGKQALSEKSNIMIVTHESATIPVCNHY